MCELFQETQRLIEKKIFDHFSDERIHQQVSSLHITSNYLWLINNMCEMIISVMNFLEATSNRSTRTPNVTEGCWKETP